MFGKGLELRQEFEAGYGDERADDVTWMWETESKEAKSWILPPQLPSINNILMPILHVENLPELLSHSSKSCEICCAH